MISEKIPKIKPKIKKKRRYNSLTIKAALLHKKGNLMDKWYRMNPYLGCCYEITEKQALKKINSRHWVRQWDSYYEMFIDLWINSKDPYRDIIYKVHEKE